ncbi:unnamed protein product [Caenorhabditis auriculariae]|uniref:Transmembrane protein 144 n=1 Tax=Caenorhabditis auriculariae TaxID=2777116 RepID=A0A8S1H3Y5_9PELO|nr:unnamed protein product [Caenorhabditis auriculariae]
MIVGFAACVVASLLFGSVFVPIKQFPPSDGFMSQFFMSLGAFIVSIGFQAFLSFPPVFPLAMLGGMLWCVANSTAFLIMNRLGMALGVLIWNTFSCTIGWATARYGLFGVPQSLPNSITLNYIGIVLLLAGSTFYLFIKSNLDPGLPSTASKVALKEAEEQVQKMDLTEEEAAPPSVSTLERFICVCAAVVNGCFFGSMCTPVAYLQSRRDVYPDAPTTGLPYLFSFFLGVIVTSTFILIIYSIVKRNSPTMPPTLVLPSLTSGVIFGFSVAAFFVGNERLSQTIAYPICAMAPGLVVSLWSVLYFKEITGTKNLILLCIAYGATVVGVAMVTVSKDINL